MVLGICLASGDSFTARAQLTGSMTQTFSGSLFDASKESCSVEVAGSSSPGTCPINFCTLNFGVRLRDGKLYKLDEGGNQKAAAALRKSKNGSKHVLGYWKTGKASKPVTARITGTLTSDTLNADSVVID